MWDRKAKPNAANIRRRISAAQDAVNAAMDLVKARAIERGESDRAMRRLLVPLDNASAWLVEAQQRLK
jgi:hypothetical protein